MDDVIDKIQDKFDLLYDKIMYFIKSRLPVKRSEFIRFIEAVDNIIDADIEFQKLVRNDIHNLATRFTQHVSESEKNADTDNKEFDGDRMYG